jgi:hypothetical protein
MKKLSHPFGAKFFLFFLSTGLCPVLIYNALSGHIPESNNHTEKRTSPEGTSYKNDG